MAYSSRRRGVRVSAAHRHAEDRAEVAWPVHFPTPWMNETLQKEFDSDKNCAVLVIQSEDRE